MKAPFTGLVTRFGLFRVGLGLMGLVFVGMLLLACVLARVECSLYGSQTERETRFGLFVGCMVKIDRNWVPRNELRVIQ